MNLAACVPVERPARFVRSGRPTSACPCCGQPLASDLGVVWDAAAQTVSGYGFSVLLSPRQSQIFDLLWRAKAQRRWQQAARIVDSIYQLDPNGGPDNPTICISQVVIRLRQAIRPLGLVIEAGRSGYLLREVAR